jgi:hypothetical protein
MVELAKRLGYSLRVGAMQANFGTPYENGIADLQDQLAEARAAGNQAEVECLEAKLDAAITAAKPGKGPDDSWATRIEECEQKCPTTSTTRWLASLQATATA